jgi:uncharacterized cupredoxin-like copper-binding protein
MLTRPRSITRLVMAVFMLMVMGTAAAAQDSKSAAIAKNLATALDAAKLTAIAAKDPSDPEAFVAAMYFSGSQLLVVGAKYSPAVLLNTKLGRRSTSTSTAPRSPAARYSSKIRAPTDSRRTTPTARPSTRSRRAASGRCSTTRGAKSRN